MRSRLKNSAPYKTDADRICYKVEFYFESRFYTQVTSSQVRRADIISSAISPLGGFESPSLYFRV